MNTDVLIDQAIAIHVDTEGMDPETIQSIEEAVLWAVSQARRG